jgi:hypothetical protein
VGFYHKYLNRSKRAQQEQQDERDIAQAALAGFRFEQMKLAGYEEPVWNTYSPSGGYCGWNSTLAGAARYCLGMMERGEVKMPGVVEGQVYGWDRLKQR